MKSTSPIFADYFKAFDTTDFYTLIQKIHSFSFSRDFLYWTMDYLTLRQHFVQIDAHLSTLLTSEFGVPQGSILGPILFNLCRRYVASECLQCAVNDVHVSAVLRKMPNQFRDGQMIQILLLIVQKQKLWSYQLHKCQNITNLKKKNNRKVQKYHSRKSPRLEITCNYT